MRLWHPSSHWPPEPQPHPTPQLSKQNQETFSARETPTQHRPHLILMQDDFGISQPWAPPRTCQAASHLEYLDPDFLSMQKETVPMDKEESSTQMVRKTNTSKMLDMDDSCICPYPLEGMVFLKLSSFQEQSPFMSMGWCLLFICQSYSISRNKPISEGNTLP